MTVGIDGGLTNPADSQSFMIGEAVSQAGTLMKLADTGKMMICDAGEEPDGYMMTDTKDHVTGVAMANVYRGVGSFIPGQKIRVPVLATNAEIAIGDKLETTAGGTVDKKDGAGYLIGKALEAVAATTGGFVTVRVYKESASS